MKTADQIAEEYIDRHGWSGTKSDVIAALKEYGAAVRQRAAEVCREMQHPDDFTPESGQWFMACEDCADAIERMELP